MYPSSSSANALLLLLPPFPSVSFSISVLRSSINLLAFAKLIVALGCLVASCRDNPRPAG
ncbi:hypothetical protein QC761_0104570 [Podospora bellae-mahoneyi]|uniref:Uncharacterized protein n=1 Tax=Podospora bellae-mahoneyi TaxID=2093777 RepID=A0ABR0F633_9PEZI|nr:hypothetical protein QC761_0104570 [Podospora bellae-mahoneyi]